MYNKCNFLILLFLFIAVVCRSQNYLSPCDIDISKNGQKLLVTAATGNKILIVDRISKQVEREIEIEAEPSGLCCAPDGKTIYVTAGKYQGKVFQINIESGKIEKEIPVGHTPSSPLLSQDGNKLYVCNRFNNDVSIINLEKGRFKTLLRIPVLREPIASDLTPDGKYLFVANHIPDGAADLHYVASKVSVINTQTLEVKIIPLVNGATGLRGLKISPDGKFAYITHLVARFLVPTTQIEHGWISTNALSVIRIEDLSLQYTVLLDDLDQGFANPWAIDFSKDGQNLLVSSAGNHEISLIFLDELTRKIAFIKEDKTQLINHDTYNDLSFLHGIRKRIKLTGKGPRSIAVSGNVAYVAHYYSDALEVIDFSDSNKIQKDYY